MAVSRAKAEGYKSYVYRASSPATGFYSSCTHGGISGGLQSLTYIYKYIRRMMQCFCSYKEPFGWGQNEEYNDKDRPYHEGLVASLQHAAAMFLCAWE